MGNVGDITLNCPSASSRSIIVPRPGRSVSRPPPDEPLLWLPDGGGLLRAMSFFNIGRYAQIDLGTVVLHFG